MFYYSHFRKKAPPPWSTCFSPTGIIFKLVQDIIGMNHLTEFHKDRTINVACREKCPAPWQQCFSSKHKSSDHISRRLGINVASRVLTRKNTPTKKMLTALDTRRTKDDHKSSPCAHIIGTNLPTKKNAPPLGSHVFQANVTIFQYIIETNLLTKFHED
ncbi:hypothetical protein DPMN_171558 [Dreissena polymorpha]|uniref:Uncharacterized protein n=1 Tax=Dreissena polymorpha TaxID=45954 RepID=A0A9D4DY81_DREPO|nr:hypothetical protein DPMN_171558 [Dreissena polymorpha]